MEPMHVAPNEESQLIWQSQNLERLRYEYDLKSSDLVIDVGAYRGEWSSQIFCRYGCKVIVIEPGPWIVGFPLGTVINKAASDRDGKISFGGAYYYTSEHEPTTHEYECFDINTLLSKHEEIALLKINIEGAEYNLLKHIIDAGLHGRIKNLQVQFHQIEGQPFTEWYIAIASALSETHKLDWQYPYCWESWSRL